MCDAKSAGEESTVRFTKMARCRFPLKILERSDLDKIHSTSLRILEEVGVKFDDDRTLRFLEENSCEVDHTKGIVKMREDLVDHCIKKVPRSFGLYSRKLGEMRVGEGDFYFVSIVDNSYMLDSETGQRRPGNLADIVDIARLMNELEFHHICCPGVIPHDAAPGLRVLHGAAEVLRNTEKHCIACPTTGLEARYFVRLGSALCGSEQDLRRRPIISTTIAPSSPLRFPRGTCDLTWEFALRRLPFVIVQAPIAGATSPVTIAGTMSLANAESLAGIVLSQLINGGAPVVYGGAISSLDMRHGVPSYGAVEYGLFSIATAQLGRFYDIPSYGAGGATNANLSDAQCGYEKMSSSMLCYLAGHDMMCDAGLNANGLTSLDSIVIQDEIMAMLARAGGSFEVNEKTLAFDVVNKVGIGGDYLSAKHTRDNFKSDFYYTDLGSRISYEGWLSRGGSDLARAALERAKRALETHKPAPLTAEENEKVNDILRRAGQEISASPT